MWTLRPASPEYFGDLWRFVSFAISVGAALDVPMDRAALAHEMAGAFGRSLHITSHGLGDPLKISDTRNTPLLPTLHCWNANANGHIAYRLDNFVDAANKSAPDEHVRLLIAACSRRGIQTLNLSRKYSVATLIDAAARARFCLCTNTGITQLCYSVGAPVHLVYYGASQHIVETWDALAATFSGDIPDFLSHMEMMI